MKDGFLMIVSGMIVACLSDLVRDTFTTHFALIVAGILIGIGGFARLISGQD